MPRVCSSCGSMNIIALPMNTYACDNCSHSWVEKAQTMTEKYIGEKAQTMTEKYIVLRDLESNKYPPNPTRIYASYQQAEHVAKKLTLEHRISFYIAKLVKVTNIVPVEVKVEDVY